MPRVLPLAAFAGALLAACSQHQALTGTAVSPPQPARRFLLTDQYGSPYELAAKADHFTLLFFGFTHCKDVCPQTLTSLAKARADAHLTPHQLPIVMVSFDPARDTPGAMRAFFSKVGVDAIGLSAPPAQLARTYRAYGVAIQPQANDIAHTAYVYLLDREGRLCEVFSPNTGPTLVARDLRAVVE